MNIETVICFVSSIVVVNIFQIYKQMVKWWRKHTSLILVHKILHTCTYTCTTILPKSMHQIAQIRFENCNVFIASQGAHPPQTPLFKQYFACFNQQLKKKTLGLLKFECYFWTFSDNLLQDNQIIGTAQNMLNFGLGAGRLKFTLHSELCHLIENFLYHANVGWLKKKYFQESL